MRLPSQLIFFVTAQCNYRCRGCFYWKNLNQNYVELALDEIEKISSSMGKFSRLLISGGEPFLRQDLPDICRIFYTQNHIRGLDLPTNGSLSEIIIRKTGLILQKCKDIKLVLGISLDGLRETHDYLRQRPGSFKSCLETIEALSGLKRNYPNRLYTHIISVVSNKNLNEIVPLVKFLRAGFDIDSIGPNPLRASPADKTIIPPTGREWLDLFKELSGHYRYFAAKRHASRVKGYLSYTHRRYLDKITAAVLDGKPLPFICKAGYAIAVLEPNADVRLCELSEPIGNLRAVDYDFKKIWFSPQAESMRRKIKSCACTHGCFLSPSIALNPYHFLRSLLPI